MTVRGKLFISNKDVGIAALIIMFSYIRLVLGLVWCLMQKPLFSPKRLPIPWLCLHVCGSSLCNQLFTTWRERGCVGNLGEFPVCAMLPHFQHIDSLSVCLVKTSVCVRRALDKGPVCVCLYFMCAHCHYLCVFACLCVCMCVRVCFMEVF